MVSLKKLHAEMLTKGLSVCTVALYKQHSLARIGLGMASFQF